MIQARLAVLIPCYNEGATIAKVVRDFRRELPEASVYVFDNGSTDGSASLAAAAGASVVRVNPQGKGLVVLAMLEQVEADYFLMVDGDDTYPADRARDLLAPVMGGEADMAVGARLDQHADGSFRPMHLAGNTLVRELVNHIFSARLSDILTGYRAFNAEVVNRIPLVSSGFEVETELTIQMLYYRRRIVEIPVAYRARPEGSQSKLRTVRDGFRVLWKLISLFRSFKPLSFFGLVGMFFLALGLLAGIAPVTDYVTDPGHFVRHVPSAILAVGLVLLSAGSLFVGLLLHAINYRIAELHSVIVRTRPRRIGR